MIQQIQHKLIDKKSIKKNSINQSIDWHEPQQQVLENLTGPFIATTIKVRKHYQ